jgi:polysaccharide biosynthesis protein PslH
MRAPRFDRPSADSREAPRSSLAVLFLSWWNPIPPDIGARIRVLALLQGLLDAGHRVDLLSFAEPAENLEDSREELARRGISSAFVRHSIHSRTRLRQIGARGRAALLRVPYAAMVSESKDMRLAVRKRLSERPCDLVIAETSWAGQYLNGVRSSRKILSWPNVDFQVYERRASGERNRLLRPLREMNFRAAKRFELELLRSFDAVLTVSEADRDHLRATLPTAPPIHVAPVTVDTTRLAYRAPRDGEGHRLLFVGAMYYQPNVDAMLHFCRQIYPRIRGRMRNVSLTIVGKEPTDQVRLLAERDRSISVAGTVPRLDQYYEQADVFVAPIRFGGGMKTKIVEAMAFGVPVVGSTAALEGISARPDREAAVHDDDDGFAQSVVALLQSASARMAMSRAARRLVEERYSPGALARSLNEIVDAVVRR